MAAARLSDPPEKQGGHPPNRGGGAFVGPGGPGWRGGWGGAWGGVVVNGHDHEGCDVLHFVEREGCSGADSVAGSEEAAMNMALDAHGMSSSSSSALNETGSPDQTAAGDGAPASPHTDTNTPPSPEAPKGPQWRATRFPPLPTSLSPLSSKECAHPSLREITLRSMMGEFGGHAGFLSAWFDPLRGERGEWVIEFASCGLGVQHWWWGVHAVDFAFLVFLVAGCVARVVEGGAGEGRGEGVVSEEEKEKRNTESPRGRAR